MRIVLAGGGTAGHIFPTLAVAHRLRDILGAAATEITIVCGSRELDRTLYRGAGFRLAPIKARGLVGVSPLRLPWRLWRLVSSTAAVWRDFATWRPHVVVASGGYVSAPALLAAKLRGVPSVLFSGDAQLGWATRALAPLARVTTVAFDEARSQVRGSRVRLTGYPLRAAFASADGAAGRAAAGMADTDFMVLVMGGSQGSHVINQAIERDLPTLLAHVRLLHVAGARDLPRLHAARDALPPQRRARYQPRDFIDQGFADLIAAADLVVSRAGATSVAELSAVGAAAVIIPGQFGAGHQIRTAEALERAGAAVTVYEQHLPAGQLTAAILDLIDNPDRLAAMRQASQQRGRPDAAGDVARLAVGLVKPSLAQGVPS